MVLVKKSFIFLFLLLFCNTLIATNRVESVSYCEQIPVLTYHDIGYAKNQFTVTPEEFESQIGYFVKQGFSFLVPGDIHLFLNQKKKFPKKSVMITFDDACKGIYSFGYPVLKKYKVRVTLFPVCMFLEREGFITFCDLDEMVSSGLFFIGSHTYDLHRSYYYPEEKKTLPATIRQKDESETEYETRILDDLKKSKEMLELMYPHLLINTFAYPFGENNTSLIKLVQKAGFQYAYAYNSKKRVFLTKSSKPFMLERYPIFPGTSFQNLIKK